MNEAERQYKQYVKIFARTYGTTIEEAAEISEKLSLSESTVNRRIKNIMSKVNEVITMKENGVPIWEKVMLTVEEASQYSNIGVNKISSLLNEPGCPFLFCVGKGKRLVKRKEFEKFIEKTLEV